MESLPCTLLLDEVGFNKEFYTEVEPVGWVTRQFCGQAVAQIKPEFLSLGAIVEETKVIYLEYMKVIADLKTHKNKRLDYNANTDKLNQFYTGWYSINSQLFKCSNCTAPCIELCLNKRAKLLAKQIPCLAVLTTDIVM